MKESLVNKLKYKVMWVNENIASSKHTILTNQNMLNFI
jgi:hypothetical protein